MGHEFVGVVDSVDRGVQRFAEGDRVVGSLTIPRGTCWYCERRHFSRCPDQRVFGYGSFFGDVAGAQADYVRVPNADLVLHAIDTSMTMSRRCSSATSSRPGMTAPRKHGSSRGTLSRWWAAVRWGSWRSWLRADSAVTSTPSTHWVSQRLRWRSSSSRGRGCTRVHAPSRPCRIEPAVAAPTQALECVGLSRAAHSIDMARAGGRIQRRSLACTATRSRTAAQYHVVEAIHS